MSRPDPPVERHLHAEHLILLLKFKHNNKQSRRIPSTCSSGKIQIIKVLLLNYSKSDALILHTTGAVLVQLSEI